MDRLIRRFDSRRDGALVICEARGVAYQADMQAGRVAYDGAYLATYDGYEASPVAEPLIAGRVALLARHAAPGAKVLDVGAAAGTFVRAARAAGFEALGFDVIPEAVARLREAGLYGDDITDVEAVTMWDSIEHMEAPEVYLKRIRKGALLVVALPIFERLDAVRASKHYKPGEHLYYWTADGFVAWMGHHGFRLLEVSAHETQAGREAIGAFAFRRDLPDYHDHIEAYKEMHATRFYGASATELHLTRAARVVREIKPRCILDYGCGRSDLVAHFWRDGARMIARYDPAIPQFKRMPEAAFDLVFCCDVLEHIPFASVDRVLSEVRAKSSAAFFTISTKLARARLPDGRNAHVTLLTPSEWKRCISAHFGDVQQVPTTDEHDLVLVAGGRA